MQEFFNRYSFLFTEYVRHLAILIIMKPYPRNDIFKCFKMFQLQRKQLRVLVHFVFNNESVQYLFIFNSIAIKS